MMKTLFFYTLFFLFTFSVIQAQEKEKVTAEKALSNYFETPREAIYLHLNKSTYVLGENIWFKGYIYDQKQGKSFKETANIYVGVYDSKGNQIKENLYRGVDGFTQGNIAVDSAFISGDYYIKASTNWMKNFTENNTYVQKIQIINKKVTVPKINKLAYDLQVFVEGGHLVNGIKNSIALKLTNQNGLGESFKQAFLLDGSGKVLLDFKGNIFGMSRFFFMPDITNSYRVKVILNNGKELITPLSKVVDKGVVLNVHNHNPDQVLIALRTNEATLKDIKLKEYKLLIHKDGVSKTTIVSFDKNKKEVIIPLNRKDVFKGVNTVTVFDENETPLLERLFFNNHDIDFPKAAISLSQIKGDSITVNVNIASNASVTKNISITILPENTRAYNHSDNISSNFLLSPYVKGYVENPAYFFRNINRNKENDLDLLLLTQGWSRYEWNSIFKGPPTENFEFENGLTLNGIFKERNLDQFKVLHISSSRNNQASFLEVQEPNFEIPALFPETDEKIKLTLVRKRGRAVVPKVSANFNVKNRFDKLNTKYFGYPTSYYEPLPNSDYELSEDIIYLDEVELTETTKKIRKPNFNSLNNVKVTAEIAQKYPQFSNLIRSRGFTVVEGVGTLFLRSNRGVVSLGGAVQTPLIILNGAIIGGNVEGNLFDILGELQTAEIDRIEIIRNGATYGSRGSNGVIKIWTRKNILDFSNGSSTPPFFVNVKNTFQPTKKFYTPKYNYKNPIFEYTGAIHWTPELILNGNGTASFKIPNTGIKNISFYIEGLGEDGTLISSKKTIHLVKQKNQ